MTSSFSHRVFRSAYGALFSLSPVLAPFLILGPCMGQGTPLHHAAGTTPGLAHHAPVARRQTVEPTELQLRIAAAKDARESGDAGAVSAANRLLLATALKEMASVQDLQGNDETAIELDRASLNFEDSYEAKLGLALATSKAGQYTQAVTLAYELQKQRPTDLRVARILGSSLLQEGKFHEAEAPMERIATVDPSIANQYAYADCLLLERTPESRERAEAQFRVIEKEAGRNGSIHVLFGRAYRDAGDLPAAIRELNVALKIDPEVPHAHYFLGLAFLSQNEWKPTPEAEAEFHKELEHYPNDYLANYLSGFLASEVRDYASAEKYLLAAEKADPKSPEPALFLGLNAYAQGNMQAAETQLRRAVALTGTDVSRGNFQIRRAYVDLSRLLAKEGKADEADAFAAKARALENQTMERTQQQVARIAGAESGAAIVSPAGDNAQTGASASEVADVARTAADSASALAKLSPATAAEVQQQDALLRKVLGLAYNDLATSEAIRGDFAAALGHYQQAERWDATLPGLEKNLGQSAFHVGDFAECDRALSAALRQDPANAPMRAMLGISYFSQDKYRQAADTFEPLGERGMQDGETGYAWAASLAHLGDNKKAAEVLSKFASAQVYPNDTMLLIGQLWTAIEDYPHAIATFQQVLQADPYLWKAHLYEGLAYLRWNHYPEARAQFEQELAIAPGDPEGEYHLGFLDLQENHVDAATARFQNVIEHHPDYANAQYQLGKIELDKGDVKQAVTHLETAAKLSPSTDFIHYQLQAAYRKAGETAQADHELAVYKQLKSASRDRAAESIPAAH